MLAVLKRVQSKLLLPEKPLNVYLPLSLTQISSMVHALTLERGNGTRSLGTQLLLLLVRSTLFTL